MKKLSEMLFETFNNTYHKEFSEVLIKLYNLRFTNQHVHWNFEGPNFIQVHEYLDKVLEWIDEYIDILAEDIRQSGFYVQDFRTYLVGVEDKSLFYLILLMEDLERNVNNILKHYYDSNVPYFTKLNEDKLINLNKEVSKSIWFLKSVNTKKSE